MSKFSKRKSLGKNLNIETHYNFHTGRITKIERDLKRLHKGWGKHRMEEQCHSAYCGRLGKVVEFEHGKPKNKNRAKREGRRY